MLNDVATDLNNLAGLLNATGRKTEAKRLFQESLEILRKAFGSKHPNVAASLWCLATLSKEAGDIKEATSLAKEAEAIYEQVLGPNHPRTLNIRAFLETL